MNLGGSRRDIGRQHVWLEGNRRRAKWYFRLLKKRSVSSRYPTSLKRKLDVSEAWRKKRLWSIIGNLNSPNVCVWSVWPSSPHITEDIDCGKGVFGILCKILYGTITALTSEFLMWVNHSAAENYKPSPEWDQREKKFVCGDIDPHEEQREWLEPTQAHSHPFFSVAANQASAA